MDIKVSTENGRVPVTILHVGGNIDAQSYQKFQSKVDELIDRGAKYLLIDLTECPYVSSAGLRSFHYTFNKLREEDTGHPVSEADVRHGVNAGTYRSPHLKLLNASKETKTALHLSGFDMFIDTFTDKEEAVASF